MKNLNFKDINYSDIMEQEINLVDWYYRKFIEIYGSKIADTIAKSFVPREDKVRFLTADSPNYQGALEIVEQLKYNEHKFIGLFINEDIIGVARILEKDDYISIPEVVFHEKIENEEQNLLIMFLVNYVQKLYQCELFIETPYKNQQLRKELLFRGFKIHLRDEKYNVDKTYLLSRKRKDYDEWDTTNK